jgi:hypothetical protein
MKMRRSFDALMALILVAAPYATASAMPSPHYEIQCATGAEPNRITLRVKGTGDYGYAYMNFAGSLDRATISLPNLTNDLYVFTLIDQSLPHGQKEVGLLVVGRTPSQNSQMFFRGRLTHFFQGCSVKEASDSDE